MSDAALREAYEEIDRLTALVEKADDLLGDARYHGTDPGLSRSWSQRRRRFRDAVEAITESKQEAAP